MRPSPHPSRLPQRLHPIPQLRRLLELEFPRRIAHTLFQLGDVPYPLLGHQMVQFLVFFERCRGQARPKTICSVLGR